MSEPNQIPVLNGIDQGSKISVIVPFHNAEKHIEDCINSLLAQDYPSADYEVIMVDNNSSDASADIVSRFSRIRLLSEKKPGSYAARNRGVAESKGDVITFTDSDCVPSPDWLRTLFDCISSPGVGLVQGRRVYSSRSMGLSLLEAYESERAIYTFSGNATGLYYGYTNNMAVRREVFERCGPFIELMRGADSIFVNRVVDEYSPDIIRYAPDALIRHSEITGVTRYLRKRFIYGRSLQQNFGLRKKTHRKMTTRESYEIIRSTVKRNNFSSMESVHLVILILASMVCFMSGRQSVKVEHLFGKARNVLGAPMF